MAVKHAKKWAVHKTGADQFGYVCSFKEEAEHMLADLQQSILHMPESDRQKYKVVEIDLSWEE